MFIMIHDANNPMIVVLLILLQLVIPLIDQISTYIVDDPPRSVDRRVYRNLIYGLVIILAYCLYVIFPYFMQLYRMRGQYPTLGWWDYLREAIRIVRLNTMRSNGTQGGRNTRRNHSSFNNNEAMNKIFRIIQTMPMEEFKSQDELTNVSITELKTRLKRRNVDITNCVERQELIDLLTTFRGGPANNDTCCICCEEYVNGDILRLLRGCKHEFHLECLDKWAYTSVSTQHKDPSCPLCNQPLE